MSLRTEATKLYHPEKTMPFPLEEYKRRMTKVKKMMAKNKIDLLYCSLPSNLFYLTGYENSWYSAEAPKGWPPMSGIAIKQREYDHRPLCR